jgi:TPR repeat protein
MSRFLIRLLAIAIAAISAPLAAQTRGFTEPLPPIDGRRIALVIGNANYAAASWPDLANADDDATHVAGRLRAAGFEVELLADAGRDTLIARLEAFGQRAGGADVALIYYGGHGFEYRLNNYIVPVDGPDRIVDTQVEERFVNMSRIVQAGAARGLSLLFLDACRSGVPVLQLTGGGEAGDRAALFGAINAPQATVFYATAPGRVAYDSAPRGSQLSPFATAVGLGIGSPGMDLPNMFSRVQDYVVRATQDRDPTQRPQFAGSWSRPFFFTPPVQVTAAATQVAGPAPAQRLEIPLRTLSTIDESTLITRVLADHSPAQMLRMAEGGDPLALYLVGYMFEWGVGVERSLPQARLWLERAAATGHPAGQLEYGYYLLNHSEGDTDRARALELYRAAAGQNYAKAMSHLASAIWTSDPGEARRLLRAAAALGDANALYTLAGQGERDASVAALERLAAAGDAEGDRWLCELGAGDEATLLGRCRRAAEAGRIDAQARLALMLAAGRGGATDAGQARSWAYLALSRRELTAGLRGQLERMLAQQGG